MKKGLITSILALTFSGLQAQPLPASPKLVVTLTIDQLRTDYMEAFSSLYGEKGFKRLLREGKVFCQAEFPFCGTDRASAIAAIYTGTTPSMNGIIAEQWLDAGTLRPINCVEDPNFMGNYTDESTSPSQLLKVWSMPSRLSAMPPYWVPGTRGTVLSGLITIPENGAVRLIIMNFRGG